MRQTKEAPEAACEPLLSDRKDISARGYLDHQSAIPVRFFICLLRGSSGAVSSSSRWPPTRARGSVPRAWVFDDDERSDGSEGVRAALALRAPGSKPELRQCSMFERPEAGPARQHSVARARRDLCRTDHLIHRLDAPAPQLNVNSLPHRAEQHLYHVLPELLTRAPLAREVRELRQPFRQLSDARAADLERRG